jgi:hypothetical protein
MAYVQQTWTDGPTGGTPMSADRFNHMEAGIVGAYVASGAQGYVTVFIHGSNASAARPPTTLPVLWLGALQPTNMIDGDVFVAVAAG